MKNPWVVIGVLVVILVGGSIAYSQYVTKSADEGVVVPEAQVKGNPDAEVTLMKFSDFSCPACAQAFPFAQALVDAYGDDIRFEYRHFAFLPNGEPAALAAEAAGQQGMFWEYHDLLFQNQGQWIQSPAPQRLFVQYAEQLDLNMDEWNRHRGSAALRNRVRDELSFGRSLGVTGTPTFFLNGERMVFETFAEFQTQVEAALGVESETAGTPGAVQELNAVEINLDDLEAGTEGAVDLQFGL